MVGAHRVDDAFEHAEVPGAGGRGAGPRLDRAVGDGERPVGDDEFRVDLHFDAEAGADAACAVGAVEGEVARLDFAEGDHVVGAGELFGEDQVVGLPSFGDGDLHHATAQHERLLDGFGEAVGEGAPIGGDFVIFGRVGVSQRGRSGRMMRSTTTSMVWRLFLARVMGSSRETTSPSTRTRTKPLCRASSRICTCSPLRSLTTGASTMRRASGVEGEDVVDHLLHGLAGDGLAANGAVRPAGSGEEEAQIVVDLGDRADRGPGVATAGFLVDGDRRGEPFDVVHIGLFHLAEELAGVGGERLDVASLAFGVDRVEGEGGFTGAGHARDDDELVSGDGDVDVLEVVLASATDNDSIQRQGSCSRENCQAGDARVDRWQSGCCV